MRRGFGLPNAREMDMSSGGASRGAALACGFVLVLAPAFAQAGGVQAPSQTAAAAAEAPAPQYWIADASIFLGNALHTSAVMANEQLPAAQTPSLYSDQAAYLVNTIQRAIDDTAGLESGAAASNPQALLAIRAIAAELISAKSDAESLYGAATRSQLGTTYAATLTSANQHLQNAQRSLELVARMYGAQNAMVGFAIK
jgi:hypothetical protein